MNKEVIADLLLSLVFIKMFLGKPTSLVIISCTTSFEGLLKLGIGGSRRNEARAKTDLPEPDSPIKACVLPFSIFKFMS